MKQRTLLLAVGSVLALSACGGGGGSAGGSVAAPGPVQTSTLSPITAANAGRVGSNAYAASASISEASTSLTDILTGVSIGRAGISTVSPVLGLVRHVLGQGAPRLLTGVTYSDNCSGGGTVSVDATVSNAQKISNGDSMTLTARNCVEDGNTLNGALTITFSNVSGDLVNSSTGAATFDTRYNGFSVASGAQTAILNGDMKIVLNQQSATSNSLALSGKSLQMTEQQAGSTIATRTLSDYSLTGSMSGTTVTSAANFAISGNTSALGQFSYVVKTTQAFVSVGTAMPASGSLIVNGAASSVTVTALGAGGVRLDYSAKGDGVITQTTTAGWSEFLASI
jgi:hypothetical protein